MVVRKTVGCKFRAISVLAAAAVLGQAQFASAVVTIYDNATVTPTPAQVGTTLGDTLTMGTNGHLVINGLSTDTTTTYTGTFMAGGTPHRGTGNILINSNASSKTTLELSGYGFTSNKTDLLFEGRNIGSSLTTDVAQIKFSTTAPTLFGASGTVTGVNSTILVHDLAAPAATAYNLGTYDATNGVRGLSIANANDYSIDTIAAGTNVLLNSSQSTAATTAVNTLTLRSAGTGVNLSGAGTLTFPSTPTAGSNGILSDGTNPNTISVATLTANAADGFAVHTIADLTINSNMTGIWLVKSNSGKLTLTGANNFNAGSNPNVNITGGILSISQDNNLGANTNDVTLLGGGLEFNASTTFHHTIRVYELVTSMNTISALNGVTADLASPIIVNAAGGVTFNGPGTIRLSAANTYTGPTAITGGTVIANHNSALSSGSTSTTIAGGANLQLNSGFTFAGSSTSLVISMLAPSSKVTVGSTGATGTTNITGGLTGSTGGTLDFDVNGVSSTDSLAVSGTVTAGGTWTINLNDLGGSSLQTGTPYTLVSGGSFTGTPTLVGNLTSSNFALDAAYHGNGLFWDTGSKTLTAQFVSAPEPASAALLGLAGIGLLARRRRTA